LHVKQTPVALRHLAGALADLRKTDLLRTRMEPVSGLSLASNDYLGLAGTGGAGASRLIAGERPAHGHLEHLLSRWLDVPQTLLFSSGYAANVGALSALVQPGDCVVSDVLNHASIIDGTRLARAKVIITPHLDARAVAAALEDQRGATRRWVVTETYFSMDADSPDLRVLRSVCDEHQAGLIVDEAHALGVFGPDGRGLCADAGIEPDVLVGTLGKAFGASGAFVAGCRDLIEWLWNRARSHVFSTGMSPTVAATAAANLSASIADPSLRARAIDLGERLRHGLRALGADVRGHGPIVPWVVGDEARALAVAEELRRQHIHVVAIRPPTVPRGTCRIRFGVTARHTEDDVDGVIRIVSRALRG
jgi:8-amino-7-oxononanoate synthase